MNPNASHPSADFYDLLNRAVRGDRKAVQSLYEASYLPVFRTVKSMIREDETVQPIVQSTFRAAFQNLNQVPDPDAFLPWLRHIAVGKAAGWAKQRDFPSLHAPAISEPVLDDRLQTFPASGVERNTALWLLNEVLNALSEEQRLMIGMFYYVRIDIPQIAAALDCPQQCVCRVLRAAQENAAGILTGLDGKSISLGQMTPTQYLSWLCHVDSQAVEAAAIRRFSQGTAADVRSAAKAGAKGMKKKSSAGKITAIVLASLLLAGSLGAGLWFLLSRQNRQEAAPFETTTANTDQDPAATEPLPTEEPTAPSVASEPTLPPFSPETAFSSILEQYRAAISADSQVYLNHQRNYINPSAWSLFSYHTYHESSFFYAFYDIDHNGTEELLVGIGSENQVSIADVYVWDGSQPLQLVYDPSLGYRASLTIMEDGLMYFFGSGGAAMGMMDFFRLGSDGHTRETVDSLHYDLTAYQGDPEKHPDVIRMRELEEFVRTCTPVTSFDWMALEAES